ncbi:MAG TPA: DUF6569 family protein [Thermoguttaceae bacterium]|nr:DUF6569 family protein [Thermoguttaceae bacterium]
MNGHSRSARFGGLAALLAATWVVTGLVGSPAAWAHPHHVPELQAYLDHARIAEPVVYRQLAVYPVLLKDHGELGGRWLTLDAALSRGVLVVSEKGGGGTVPSVIVENRSRDEHVFIMTGEVISGGKQTRTVRQDVVLSPGERIELSVFCVEAHRWQGGEQFSAGKALLPQSIQKELRKGADQQQVWSEVARNNQALQAENASGSLELALNSAPVRKKLAEVQQHVVPNVPQGTVGYIFVSGGRAVGAEFFGGEKLAQELLPKLLDSYAVDFVLLHKGAAEQWRPGNHREAIDFFERIRRTGSERSGTPGSGAGIRTRDGGLIGDGVSLGGTVVHFAVQVRDRIIPLPKPRPIPYQRNAPLEQRR